MDGRLFRMPDIDASPIPKLSQLRVLWRSMRLVKRYRTQKPGLSGRMTSASITPSLISPLVLVIQKQTGHFYNRRIFLAKE